jgi:hypothetical protein
VSPRKACLRNSRPAPGRIRGCRPRSRPRNSILGGSGRSGTSGRPCQAFTLRRGAPDRGEAWLNPSAGGRQAGMVAAGPEPRRFRGIVSGFREPSGGVSVVPADGPPGSGVK